MTDQNHIIRPIPRKAFERTPTSTDSSNPPTPSSPENTNVELLESKLNGNAPPSRTRSFLNLTSSTLFGIYSPTGEDFPRDESATPWGTGAQTPSSRRSVEGPPIRDLASIEASTNTKVLHHPCVNPAEKIVSLIFRSLVLSGFGLAYGTVITHLHESEQVAPVKVGGIDRQSWVYILFWGVSGVGLGNLLPWIDTQAEQVSLGSDAAEANASVKKRPSLERQNSSGPAESNLGADWNPAVRGIGAFVGIAFAIRRLQWQSTMQASLTLALVNPCLWYMIDRTQTGFCLSAAVGILGTIVLFFINPSLVPPPTTNSARSVLATGLSQRFGKDNVITDESIAVATWIASVLFCGCVCFGNIGRRIALGGGFTKYGKEKNRYESGRIF